MSKQRKVLKDMPYAENKIYEVEVYYDIGGMSYFTGNNSPRGYYITVRPVELQWHEYEGKKFATRSFMIFSGYKKFLKEANKFSQKTFDNLIVPEELIIELVKAVAIKEKLPLPEGILA